MRRADQIQLGCALVLWLCCLAGAAQAANIALWDFGAGSAADTSGSPTAYDLGSVGGGPDLSQGFARFTGDEASPAYLEIAGPGGMKTWTLSFWVRSQGSLDQGTFQGIFSNNTSSTAAFSWQVESHGGVYQWRNQAGTFAIGAPAALDTWDHIVVRKFSGNDGDIWLNGVQILANIGGNPGGLQSLRLGTNRNSNRFFQGDLENIYVFDSFEDPTALFVNTIPNPEPTTGLLLLGGLCGVSYASRRQKTARI